MVYKSMSVQALQPSHPVPRAHVLQPRWPPLCPPHIPTSSPPQDLCTRLSPCQECSSSRPAPASSPCPSDLSFPCAFLRRAIPHPHSTDTPPPAMSPQTSFPQGTYHSLTSSYPWLSCLLCPSPCLVQDYTQGCSTAKGSCSKIRNKLEQTFTSPSSSCVTWGKPRNFSDLSFHIWKMEPIRSPTCNGIDEH